MHLHPLSCVLKQQLFPLRYLCYKYFCAKKIATSGKLIKSTKINNCPWLSLYSKTDSHKHFYNKIEHLNFDTVIFIGITWDVKLQIMSAQKTRTNKFDSVLTSKLLDWFRYFLNLVWWRTAFYINLIITLL